MAPSLSRSENISAHEGSTSAVSSHALLVFGFLFGIALTIGVGVHAHNRGRSGFLWGLLTFFTGIIGAFIYLLVTLTSDGDDTGDDGRSDVRRVCPACSSVHAGEPNYCEECGEALGPDDDRPDSTILRSGSQGYCSNCKGEVKFDADTCPNCGALL